MSEMQLEVMFWVVCGIVLYTYAGYPLLLIVLSLFIRRPVEKDDSYIPPVSLLIAAHNEEDVIETKIRNSLALDYPAGRLQIAVASDGSNDSTVEIVRSFGKDNVALLNYPERRGKVAVINESVPRLAGAIVVLSDASVMYEPDAIRKLARNFSDPQVGGVWGNKEYRNPAEGISGAGESLYLKYEKFSKRRESRLGSIVSAEGSMFAIRKKLFQPIPDLSVADDYYLSAWIRHTGHRLVYEPEARSYEDVAPTSGDEFRRKIRIVHGGLKGFVLMRRLANPFATGIYSVQVISRQFLRRAVALLFPFILFLNLLLVSRPGAPFYTATLACQIMLLLLATAGALYPKHRGRPPFLLYAPYYFAMVNAAAIVGMWRLARGHEAALWQPTGRNKGTASP